MDFAQEEGAREKVREDGGEVMPQATPDLYSGAETSQQGKKTPQTSQTFFLLPTLVQYPSDKKWDESRH